MDVIRTPDQRVRVFVSSTLRELAAEREAVREAVTSLRLVPVMFELGARSHPPRSVYRAYLAQSQVFVGVYWQSYGWVAPGEEVSGLEDEYLLSAGLPRLIYVKSPAPERDPRLKELLARMSGDGDVTYRVISDPQELQRLVEDDLAVLLSESFEVASSHAGGRGASLAAPLPVPATRLVGRESEVAAVEDLIGGQGVRLVTLTGPGGVGKSRLAVEAAQRLNRHFADGARLVELASVPTADLVAAAIAEQLGLSTSSGRLVGDLHLYLRDRRILLVLDNFEHVAEAAPLVAELLRRAAGLAALVTSRAVLRLSGEHELGVLPLALPPAGMVHEVDGLRRYSSVSLFVQRAQAVAPDFDLTWANAQSVAEICRRLDGLPLAIELAAAKVRLLPPQALLSRLSQRFSLLTGGARDLPERQRTLKNALDWSLDLLSDDQQALFARLGVFAGSFTLTAAEAVGPVGKKQAGQVMKALGALVDNTLVRADNRGSEPRFAMLETIREYALERLRYTGGWNRTHDAHAAYFLQLAKPASAELYGPAQLAWMDRLEAERDNVSAAMSWLVDRGEVEQAVDLLWQTWRFWWLRGHAAQFTRFGEKLVASSEHLPPFYRAFALTEAGFILLANGDQARALMLFEQSLPLYRRAKQKLGLAMTAHVVGVLGRLAALREDYSRAGELLDQSRAILRDLGPLAGYERLQQQLTIAQVDNFLGQVRLSQGDHEEAARLFTDSLAAARGAPDRISILISLYNLAFARRAAGDLKGAFGYLSEGLGLAAEAGDETSVAYYLEGLAAVVADQADPQRAVRMLSAAQSLLEDNGSGWLHAWVPRPAHDSSALAELRSALSDIDFEEARAWGRSASSRCAAEFALHAPATST